MMLIRLNCLSLMLLSLMTASATFAQKRTVQAYIVTAAEDTVHGVLKRQSEKVMLRSIRFKPAGAGTFASYAPTQIKAYGTGDSLQYVAREVLTDGQQQPVFLKVMVKGPASLYTAEGLNNGGDFYVQRQDEKVVQLQKRHNLTELNYLLSDCPQLQNGPENSRKSRYSGKHLTSTIHAYNTCRHPDEISEVLFRPNKIYYLVGVRLGSHIGHTKYNGSDIFQEKNLNEKVPVTSNIMGGVFLNISDESSILMLQTELLYRNYISRHNVQEPRYSRSFDFKATALQVPLLLQFKLPMLQHIQPYISAGFSFGYLFNPTLTHEINYTNSSTRISRTAIEGVENGTIGFVGGGGLFYKLSDRNRLLLDIRYSQETVETFVKTKHGNEHRRLDLSGLQITTGITL